MIGDRSDDAPDASAPAGGPASAPTPATDPARSELSGDAAWALVDALRERNRRIRADQLAAARADADARGKQPFDLAALEALCDTSREGRIDPVDERRARFEEMYYTWFPDVMTLAEFAKRVCALESW
jgi:hypothetical protein